MLEIGGSALPALWEEGIGLRLPIPAYPFTLLSPLVPKINLSLVMSALDHSLRVIYSLFEVVFHPGPEPFNAGFPPPVYGIKI